MHCTLCANMSLDWMNKTELNWIESICNSLISFTVLHVPFAQAQQTHNSVHPLYFFLYFFTYSFISITFHLFFSFIIFFWHHGLSKRYISILIDGFSPLPFTYKHNNFSKRFNWIRVRKMQMNSIFLWLCFDIQFS